MANCNQLVRYDQTEKHTHAQRTSGICYCRTLYQYFGDNSELASAHRDIWISEWSACFARMKIPVSGPSLASAGTFDALLLCLMQYIIHTHTRINQAPFATPAYTTHPCPCSAASPTVSWCSRPWRSASASAFRCEFPVPVCVCAVHYR